MEASSRFTYQRLRISQFGRYFLVGSKGGPEAFAGGIDGESAVRALQVRGDGRSVTMVSMQRSCGKLGGRQGTFVLLAAVTLENGKSKAT